MKWSLKLGRILGIDVFVHFTFLLLIAWFVWIGATQEAAAVELKSSLSGVPVRETMLTNFKVLSPDDTLFMIRTALAGRPRSSPPPLPARPAPPLLAPPVILRKPAH